MNKKIRNAYILMAITAILVTVTGVIFKQAFLRMLPLYFTLVIMFLNSRIIRYGSLIGGLNCLLYTYTNFHYKLYASAFFTLFFSFPIQIITFVLWTKRKVGMTTKLRCMTTKQRWIVFLLSVVSCGVGVFILDKVGGSHGLIDMTANIVGIIVTFMTMFAYVEYTYINILNGALGIILNLAVAIEQPEMIPYLIMAVYSFICILRAFFNARRIYEEQQAMFLNQKR